MKKVITLLLVITSLLLLASCSSIDKDPIEVGRKAAEEGYYVHISIDEADLEDYRGTSGIIPYMGDMYCVVECEHKSGDIGAFIFYYDKLDDAKDAERTMNREFDRLKEESSEAYDYVIKREGKVLFFGHEDILEDLKK